MQQAALYGLPRTLASCRMRPCPNCNARITPGASDCASCGALIPGETPRLETESFGVLHLPIFLMNTGALMIWADGFFTTSVTAFWYITFPFALAYAAVPYFLFVAVPTRSASPRVIVGVSAAISIGIAVLLIAKGSQSVEHLLPKLGFAAQMSLIPCAPLAVLRYIAERLPQHRKENGETHES